LLERQRLLEREHESEQHRREDTLRWVEQRKALYAEILAAYREWLGDVRVWGDPAPWVDPQQANQEYFESRTFDYKQVTARLRHPLGELLLIGSDEVERSAERLHAQLYAIEVMRVGDEPPTSKKMLEEVERRYEQLVVGMRRDLGVTIDRSSGGDDRNLASTE